MLFEKGDMLWTNTVLQDIERKLLCPQDGEPGNTF